MWSKEGRTESSYKLFVLAQAAIPTPLPTALGCFWQCGTKQEWCKRGREQMGRRDLNYTKVYSTEREGKSQ